jgi:hypothetical protein
MDGLHRRIGSPVLTNLRLEPFGLEVLPGSVTPARLPDLFEGRPVVVCGRYRGSPRGSLALKATDTEGKAWTAEAAPRTAEVPALSSVWARGKLRELEDRYAVGADRATLEKQIVALSLRFGVLCRFTSFVAVDRAAVVNPGGDVHQVTQPVEMPAGWAGKPQAAMAPPSGTPMPCAAAPAAACPPRKVMLAKQMLQEKNAGGRVSRKTELAVEAAAQAETKDQSAAPSPPADGEVCEVESVDSYLMEFSDEAARGSASSVPPAQAGPDVEDSEVECELEEEGLDLCLDAAEEETSAPPAQAPPPQSKPTVKGKKGFSDDLDAPRSRKERRAKSKASPARQSENEDILFSHERLSLGDHDSGDSRGWLQRLLDWFRGKSGTSAGNREPFRVGARDLLQRMHKTVSGAARRDFLNRTRPVLEALHLSLVEAKDQHPAVALLGEALLKVEALSQSVPDDAAIRAAWEAVETALTNYLGDAPETTAAPREGFWK